MSGENIPLVQVAHAVRMRQSFRSDWVLFSGTYNGVYTVYSYGLDWPIAAYSNSRRCWVLNKTHLSDATTHHMAHVIKGVDGKRVHLELDELRLCLHGGFDLDRMLEAAPDLRRAVLAAKAWQTLTDAT